MILSILPVMILVILIFRYLVQFPASFLIRVWLCWVICDTRISPPPHRMRSISHHIQNLPGGQMVMWCTIRHKLDQYGQVEVIIISKSDADVTIDNCLYLTILKTFVPRKYDTYVHKFRDLTEATCEGW